MKRSRALLKSNSFDWLVSKPHIFLLSLFLKGRSIYTITRGGWNEIWEQQLGEKPEIALNRFVVQNKLIPAGLGEVLWVKFTVPELQKICDEYGLPVSGRKLEIINRIICNVPKSIIRKLTQNDDIFICSESGKPIAEEYIEAEKERKSEAISATWEQIIRNCLTEAVHKRTEFETQNVDLSSVHYKWHPDRFDNNLFVLKLIFTAKPKLLKNLSTEQFTAIQKIAALSYLWGEREAKKWLPAGFESYSSYPDKMVPPRMVMFCGHNQANLEEYKENPAVIRAVAIISANDSCENCKKFVGKVFSLSDVPELPNENCTSPKGCRCSYIPITDLFS